MSIKFVGVTMVGVAAIVAFCSTLRAQQPTPTTRSVLDGVYTEEQAKRGNTGYGQNCASCHGPALAGEDESPALAGGAFISNWSGTNLGELFERIQQSMPGNNPGSLSRQENADILAYILSYNKYPAGKVELPRETQILSQIRIDAPKPGN
jgi:mono/diheme cytochrome c family protein